MDHFYRLTAHSIILFCKYGVRFVVVMTPDYSIVTIICFQHLTSTVCDHVDS